MNRRRRMAGGRLRAVPGAIASFMPGIWTYCETT
jgi:hypothetical protein